MENENKEPNEKNTETGKAAHEKSSAVRMERREDGIRILTFDCPGSSANLLDQAVFEELGRHLDSLASDSAVRGLVFASAKPSIFIAGADLRALSDGVTREDVERLVDLGQGIMQRIADFPVPTVAAIHGACAGGGCELALACEWRVASDDRSTRVGLPETQLGLIPAWGGCTRLTRLLGPAVASDLILNGKLLPAKKARKRGLVDAVCPREHLLDLAVRKVQSGRNRAGRDTVAFARRLQAPVVEWIARRRLKNRGASHYPAPGLALSVIARGALRPERESLRREKEAIAEAALTDVCKNLIHLFFLREKASKSTGKASLPSELAVVGAGVMGSGIAQWFSSRGSRVVLNDIGAEQLDRGMAAVARLYGQGVKRGIFTDHERRRAMDRISPAVEAVPLPRTELVVEAAAEELSVKTKIFRDLESRTGPETLLATNTSALSITEIAAACGNPERVIGMHFFNPVHRMPLVEIVPGEKTGPGVAEKTLDIARSAGKVPVVVRDRPGFLVNRILMPYLVEAVLLFEEGTAVKDIDEAMTAFGMPMGPLRLLDEVGIDVAGHVARTLADAYPDRMQTPGTLKTLLREKRLGKKSGAGFYDHGSRGPRPAPGMRELQNERSAGEPDAKAITERLTFALINEAARCLEEEIVASAEDLDLAIVLGTGFAPFRGGPLRHADAVGAGPIVTRLKTLEKSTGKRFAPCKLLTRKAETDETFF